LDRFSAWILWRELQAAQAKEEVGDVAGGAAGFGVAYAVDGDYCDALFHL